MASHLFDSPDKYNRSQQFHQPSILIGIPAALQEPQDEIGAGASVVPQSYIRAIEQAGGVPLPIPITDREATLRAIYGLIDGLLLAGGVDIDPAHFAEEPNPQLGKVDASRDRVELALTRWALDDQRPILGICRGIQTLNVASGGTLWQDIDAQVPAALDHKHQPGRPYTYRAHPVSVEPGSRLARLVGASELQVNSLHHQAPKEAGHGLRAVAWAPDGVIEGLEGTGDGWIIGVQWHPEWLLDDPCMLGLLQAFVRAAGATTGRPLPVGM
jgi:putative glutamine amidotransferase